MMSKIAAALLIAATMTPAAHAAEAAPLRPDQAAFRETYRELVETNTTLSAGDCTLAAQRMAARLKTAGMSDDQLTVFTVPDHPKEGGLVAVWPGSSKSARPILLLAHIDVVEARREDWTRDPFVLVEENGYFYARGATDDKAMAAIAVNPADPAALAVLGRDKMLHSMLRTTCVATLVDGGHALNALPQSVTANVNCRLFPGRTLEETQAALVAAVGNPAIRIEPRVKDKPIATPPPLDPQIVGPMEQLAKKHFPGVPVIPTISTGATDGVYTGAAGIPTYGVPGLWVDPDGNGTHGLNERMEVRALYAGREYLFDLVKLLANSK